MSDLTLGPSLEGTIVAISTLTAVLADSTTEEVVLEIEDALSTPLTLESDLVGVILSPDIGSGGEFPHVHTWDNISGKPATFPPSTHDHNSLYYTETELSTDSDAEVHWDNLTNVPEIIGEQGEQGIQGIQGEQGIPGDDGLSAYEVALGNGFVGTELEWLDSLQGEDGEQGIQGIPGEDGEQGIQGIQGEIGETGAQGIPGEDGLSAYEVALDNGFVGTELEWLDSLEGEQGIQGETGEQGIQGDQGIQGVPGDAADIVAEIDAAPEQTVLENANRFPITDDGVLKYVEWETIVAAISGGSFVDLTTNQDVGGVKTFTDPITLGSDSWLDFKDADVAHGMTAILPTDQYGQIATISGVSGGLLLFGLSDTDTTAFQLSGIIGSDNPTDTTPVLLLSGSKKSGTGAQPLGDAETVFALNNYTTRLMTIFGNSGVVIGGAAQLGSAPLTVYDTGVIPLAYFVNEIAATYSDVSPNASINLRSRFTGEGANTDTARIKWGLAATYSSSGTRFAIDILNSAGNFINALTIKSTEFTVDMDFRAQGSSGSYFIQPDAPFGIYGNLIAIGAQEAQFNLTTPAGTWSLWRKPDPDGNLYIYNGIERMKFWASGPIDVQAGASSDWARLGGTMYSNGAVISSSGAVETNLHVYTVPANTLAYDGDQIIWEEFGAFAANGNSKTIRVYAHAFILARTVTANGGAWHVRIIVTRYSSTLLQVHAEIRIGGSGGVGTTSGLMTYSAPAFVDSNTFVIGSTGQATTTGDIASAFASARYYPVNT